MLVDCPWAAQLLLDHKANASDGLFASAILRAEDIVRLLIRYGAHLDSKAVNDSFSWVLESESCRFLLKCITDDLLKSDNQTLLHLVLISEDLNTARKCLELGADPNCKETRITSPAGMPLLCEVAEITLNNDRCALLLEFGARINARVTGSEFGSMAGSTALYHAVFNCDVELCRTLLHKGANPNLSKANRSSGKHLSMLRTDA